VFARVHDPPRTCKPMPCALLKACPALIQLVASATHRGLRSVAHKNDGRPGGMRTVPTGGTDRLQHESLHTKKGKNAQVSLIPDQWRSRSPRNENRLAVQSDSTLSSSREDLRSLIIARRGAVASCALTINVGRLVLIRAERGCRCSRTHTVAHMGRGPAIHVGRLEVVGR